MAAQGKPRRPPAINQSRAAGPGQGARRSIRGCLFPSEKIRVIRAEGLLGNPWFPLPRQKSVKTCAESL